MFNFDIPTLSVFEWQRYFFDLSLGASNVLAVGVGFLTVILFIRKAIERYWNRTVDKRKPWLTLLLDVYTKEEKKITLDHLKTLGRVDRAITKKLLLQRAEDSEGLELKRLSAIYEAIGYASQHILTLKGSLLWWKRAEAAHHLGHMLIRRSHDILSKALDDSSTEVRLEATWALGHMGFVEDLPKIVKSMSYFFKIAALRMDAFIFEMGKPALPVLLDLCKDPDFEVQLLAIHLVGEFKDSKALSMLLPLLQAKNLECKLAACKALGTLGDEAGLKELIPTLKDEAWQMRAQVAKQFGRCHYKQAIPTMMKGMEDQAWWVRYNTGEAFFLMGEVGLTALKETLQSQDRYARDMAAQWLDEEQAKVA